MILYLDLETRWALDLRQHGAARCAADPSAGINCAGYAIDDGPADCIKYPVTCPPWFRKLLDQADIIVAHNAEFEIVCLWFIWGIWIPLSKWRCSMTKAAYYGYPRRLDEAAKAIGCAHLKDVQGKSVMQKLCTGLYTPETALLDFERLYSYNIKDVEPMRDIHKALPDIPASVQELWELNTEINLRGMPIDTDAIRNALVIKQMASENADARMYELTDGYVNTVGQVAKIQEFALLNGVHMTDCKADTVRKTLEKEINSDVKTVLELRQAEGLSSLAKYEAIDRYLVDGKLYQMFDFYGCHTGRPRGNGPQVMNLPRSQDAETYAEVLSRSVELFCLFYEEAQGLKKAVRGCFKAPPGFTLLGVDLSQIEARATGWLAGAQNYLDLFAPGKDPYCEYGKDMWGCTITKADLIKRTSAKAAVLSMGFLGGIGAYQRNAEQYDLDLNILATIILPGASPAELSEGTRNYGYYRSKFPPKPLSEAEGVAADIVKQRFRRDFFRIVQFGAELEQAFLAGGNAGFINIERKPSGLRILTLPSGRQLFYHDVQITTDGSYSYHGRHMTEWLWKGTLIENCAQSINFDISEHYKLQANKWIAPCVHHCYDEFTLLVEKTRIEEVEKQVRELMATRLAWTEGLPLAFDLWKGDRYGK